MKKNKKIIVLIIIVCIFAIIGIVICLKMQPKDALYISSYQNSAWGQQDYGYIIYSDGTIKEYDSYNTDKELKKSKISKEELKRLKELSNLVEDKYEKSTSNIQIMDAGYSKEEVYNRKLDKWVVLSTFGNSNGANSTEEGKEILELVRSIENTYLK